MSFLDDMKNKSKETRNQKQNEGEIKRQNIISAMSDHCLRIIKSLKEDIKKDATGEGQWKGFVMGDVVYYLADNEGKRISVAIHYDGVKPEDIVATTGYNELKSYCEELELDIEISTVDDDDINSEISYKHIVVRIGGWN